MFSRRTMTATLRNLFLLLPPHLFSLALIFSVISLLFSSCYSIDEQGRAILTWKGNLTSSTDALRSWKAEDETPCLWFGVFCDSKGEVVEIALIVVDLQGTLPTNFQSLKFLSSISISSTNISGTIPKEFGDYNELKVIDLSNNNLSGEIPEEICKLSKLQELYLYGNAFEGSIPLEIGDLSSLASLTIFDNNLSGEIPKSIGRLKELQVFRAGGNKNLRGELPMEIGNCSSLVLLGIAETGISGRIPSTIGMLKRVQTIAIYSSQLSGPIPEEIGSCSELQSLYLYQNNISGPIPRRLGELRNLQSVLLWQNNLEGEIPDELGDCKELIVLDLSDNLLTGSIPKSLGGLSNLQELQLSLNKLSGTIPSEISNCLALSHLEVDNNMISGEIPVAIGNLKNLTIFFAWKNNLTGSIPSTLSNCQNLEALDLSFNDLVSPIPEQIFGLKNLTKVLLISNKLSGFIPPDIGNCTNLYRLRLNENRIGGTIPSEIGNLKNLNFFDMGENLLVGGIPPSLSECENLEFLDLHSNGLTGPFPDRLPKRLQILDISNNRFNGQVSPSIGGLLELTKLDLGKNQLFGKIPGEITSCKKLQFLDLGNNRISGELPKELGQISSLEIALNLSYNQFSGEIPSQFSGLTKLGILDLSHNNLSGNLSHLVELQNLVSLNVSYNNFSGELPDKPFFQKLPLSNIAGNKGLYTSGGLVTPADNVVSNSRSRGVVKVGMPILISTSAVLILLAIYMLIRTHIANSSLLSEGENWEITLYQKLEFPIDDIVRNLTSSNIIGTGSSGVVYRVTTPNGETMAVKKMWPNEESGAFSSEIQTLGSIRHKNIIRLLGWGSNRNLNLLFYDYLPNGSLSSLLHGAGKGGAEWEARYKILLGVAHALEYLHHDCLPPILHGDVKAMNVLLGHGFQPYLADFGLARIASITRDDDGSGKPLQRPIHLAGSYGYMAPEHGSMQRITEKSDVYSFGVVIVEVLTGRHPLDPTIPGGVSLVQWVRDYLAGKRDHVAIFDSKLRGRADPAMHEMLQTLAIALLCVGDRAGDRPAMKDVVAMLKEIRHVELGRAAADSPKAGAGTAVVQPSPPPRSLSRKFVSQGSSQCSFVFSDDSI